MQAYELYQEILAEHSRHSCCRPLAHATASHAMENPSCGDRVSVQVLHEGDRIAAVGGKISGCLIVQASASLMAQLCSGKHKTEVLALCAAVFQMLQGGTEASKQVELGDAAALAVIKEFPTRLGCALLPWDALQHCFPEDSP